MKTVILAGGLGTRLAEKTEVIPKPMVPIGGRPILWHIMKHYAHFSSDEFVVALGYKGEEIKRYFLEYHTLAGDLSVKLDSGDVQVHKPESETWEVHLVDTGERTNTGGRLRRLQTWLDDGPFFLTYGDGICSVDIEKLLEFHQHHGKVATVTAVRPPARFGGLVYEGDKVVEFTEKPQIGEGWINGGFFVFEQRIFDYLSGDETSLEADALEKLAADGQLMAYRHEDFWQCMDTLREVKLLETLWQSGEPPWKVWD